MIHDPISALRSRAEMLQVAELLHRIGNDYTRAIAFASLRAANASSSEARSALNEVVNHLLATAEMHRVHLRIDAFGQRLATAQRDDLRRREGELDFELDNSMMRARNIRGAQRRWRSPPQLRPPRTSG